MSSVARIKHLVRSAIDGVAGRIGGVQTWWTCRRAGSTPIQVLDIDNTLADTWPSFLQSWPNERARLAQLPLVPKMKQIAHDGPVADGASVLFLTHRAVWLWPTTYSWLRRNGFAVRWSNLVLVASPADKVAHLRRCIAGRSVTYWDDLSHGHEHGEVQLYDDVIAAVRDLDLEYHGYAEIMALAAPPAGR